MSVQTESVSISINADKAGPRFANKTDSQSATGTPVEHQSEIEIDPEILAQELQKTTENLERIYEKIYRERMHDIPIINDTIGVHAIGFQAWQNTYLGVMITPWFMNLMLLPNDSEDWSDKPELSKVSQVFPSGKYTFNIGYEAELGHYQSCSLFSPMFEFADDEAALDTAEAVLKELMNIENIERTDIDSAQIERVWNGEASEEELREVLAERDGIDVEQVELPTAPEDDKEKPTLSEKINKPMSRRNLIRGSFLKDEEK